MLMKNIYLLCLGFLSVSCFAQNDSLTVSHTRWETKRLAQGIHLKQHAFNNNLFSSNQYISVLEVNQRKKNHFSVAAEKQLLRNTSDFGKSAKAIAALNGTFFDIKNGGSVDYIRSNGQEINSTRLNGKGERAVHQKAALLINKGKLSIATWDGTNGWEQNIKADDIMVSGPLLLRNNMNVLVPDTGSLVKLRHPRTAVAKVKNKILLVAVDGRSETGSGMSLSELASFLHWLHATDGINLDGGGSTTLWVDSRSVQGIVNHPSDNQKPDRKGDERKVANALLVTRR
jgi:exopolysaccharide biosynthesis protein